MHRHATKRGMLNLLALLAALAACSDRAPITAPVTVSDSPARLEVVSGAGQPGTPGAQLPRPIVVRAVATNGAPVPGARVEFKVVTGGGSVEPSVGITDRTGAVAARWTLGPAGGQQQVQAVTTSLDGSPTAVIVDPGDKVARPAASVTIDLAIVRLDGGSGPALVSNGIPLPPGLMRPADVRHVAIFVGDVEQPVYVEPLGGLRPDGSVRSLLVQFSSDVPATGFVPAKLLIGPQVTRSTSDRTKVAPAFSYPNTPTMQAAALPTSVPYLLSTGIVGPTVAAPDGFDPKYEQTFVSQLDLRWAAEMPQWGTTLTADGAIFWNYYDRAMISWAWWVRTGNPEYFRRAMYYFIAFRDLYLIPNRYRTQPHQWQMEGMTLHYLLTGDAETQKGIGVIAKTLAYAAWLPHIGDTAYQYTEGRIQERVIQAFLAGWRAGLTNLDYPSALRTALTKVLGTQSADGAFRTRNACGGSSNFMAVLLDDIMIRYVEDFEPDPRVLPAVKRNLDWLWNTQWRSDAGGFNYYELNCPGQGGPTAAPDLNLLFAAPFGWVYQQTGETAYRERGDTIFVEGVKRAWLGSNGLQADKQFNEDYRSSFRYLAYRR